MSKQLITLTLSLVFVTATFAQNITDDEAAQAVQLNTITTAVPFLLIAPDTRGGALGDAGVATSPDGNSLHWNVAKLAFLQDMSGAKVKSEKPDFGISLSYSPWLRALVDDMSLAYLTGYKVLNDKQAITGGLRFFSLGNITFTDINGSVIRDFEPIEFSFDVGFSQKLSEKLSGGFAARYIHSNLTGGVGVNGAGSQAGRSAAADVSMFYTNPDLKIGGKDTRLNLGVNISNIGAKVSYTETADRDFLPANLRLGAAMTMNFDDYNQLTLTSDFNKLLVPTPPVYAEGEGGTEEPVIISGRDPDVGVASGIFGSFTDAPGNVLFDENDEPFVEDGSILREELREINISIGLEYVYANQFAFRTGFFHEDPTKGNRQFITLGAGVKFQVFSIDMSYLISTRNQNPLANTLRFGLNMNLPQGGGGSSE
ncbi:MAG: type IX secretion system outer membrane channel protein PorV [Flavobacteriales bacterium]